MCSGSQIGGSDKRNAPKLAPGALKLALKAVNSVAKFGALGALGGKFRVF